MRRGLAGLTLTLLTLSLASAPAAYSNQFPGETPTYAREVGQEQHFFYGSSGGATDQIEYICKAFAGTSGSDDLTSSVWQVVRFSYNVGGQITDIEYAGDDDGYNQICDNRASLNYD